MLDAGIDTVVLGCTHYPFVIPLIQEIAGKDVQVIDPAPAVARQVGRVLDAQQLRNTRGEPGTARFFTTGDVRLFEVMLYELLGEKGTAIRLDWHAGQLIAGG